MRCPRGAAFVVVVAASVTEGGAFESSACIGAVRGAFACAGAAGTDARSVANAVRIRGRRDAPNLAPAVLGIHATLRPHTLRRRALRCDAFAPAPRPDSRGSAGALKTDYVLPRMGGAMLRPLQTRIGTAHVIIKNCATAQNSQPMGLRVGFVSLGCPKNLVDSEVMMGILARERLRTDASRR